MLREKKEQIVAKLADKIESSSIIIATNYQGLPAKEMTELRNTLAKMGVEYHVVKNTLAWFAADKAGRKQLRNIIEGTVALAFGYGDAANAVKVLTQYIKSTEAPLQIKGGLVGERLLTPNEVASLANLPSREVLVSQLITQLKVPINNLHNVLNCLPQRLLAVLQSRAQQKVTE